MRIASIASSKRRLDPDASAYFDACVTAGGGYSSSGRIAVNRYIAGLKASGLWPLVVDHGLFIDQSFSGILVKLKGSGSLVNNNFVTGDYTTSGAAAGLLGNGTTKYLSTGAVATTVGSVASIHLSAYTTVAATAGNRCSIGTYISSSQACFIRSANSSDSSDFSLGNLAGGNNGLRTGSTLGSIISGNTYGFSNGSQIHVRSTSGALPALGLYLFGSNTSGVLSAPSNERLTLYTAGVGLTPAQCSTLATLQNTLMTEFGANKY